MFKAIISQEHAIRTQQLTMPTTEYHMQYRFSHTFISSDWLPAAEGTTSTLCKNGYAYKVLLPHFQACDVERWGGRHAGVCGRSGSGPPILKGVLWVGHSTQVSWRRPGDSDCSSGGQWCQGDVPWGTHCSKGNGSQYQNMLKHESIVCQSQFRTTHAVAHCHTFAGCHWLPAAEGTTSTLCTNG